MPKLKLARWREALGVWIRLTTYLGPRKGRLIAAAAVSALAVGFELAKPWPLKVVIDQVLLGKPWSFLPGSLSHGDTLCGGRSRRRLGSPRWAVSPRTPAISGWRMQDSAR